MSEGECPFSEPKPDSEFQRDCKFGGTCMPSGWKDNYMRCRDYLEALAYEANLRVQK